MDGTSCRDLCPPPPIPTVSFIKEMRNTTSEARLSQSVMDLMNLTSYCSEPSPMRQSPQLTPWGSSLPCGHSWRIYHIHHHHGH